VFVPQNENGGLARYAANLAVNKLVRNRVAYNQDLPARKVANNVGKSF
jgi:hypothetical protein